MPIEIPRGTGRNWLGHPFPRVMSVARCVQEWVKNIWDDLLRQRK